MSQILLEKDKQIECLKSIIVLKEQQNQTQKSLIESLQKQLQTEKKLTQLLSNQKNLLKQKLRPPPPDKRSLKKEGEEERGGNEEEEIEEEEGGRKKKGGAMGEGRKEEGREMDDREEGRRKKEEGGRVEEGRGRGVSVRTNFDDLPKITEMDESPLQTENNEGDLEDYIAELGGNRKRAQSVNKAPIELIQKEGGMLERARTERIRIDDIFNNLDEGEKEGERISINIEPEKELENFSLSFKENADESPTWMSKKLERRSSKMFCDELRSAVVALNYESYLLPESTTPSLNPLDSDSVPRIPFPRGNLRRKSSIIGFNPKKRLTVIMSRKMTVDDKEEEKMRNTEGGGDKTDKSLEMNEGKLDEKKEREKLEGDEEGKLKDGNENLEKKKEKTMKKKIFESFFMIGVGKEDLGDFGEGKNKGYLDSKIIYDFPKGKEMNRDTIIHEFAFPKGVPVKKVKIGTSFEKLNELAFSYNPNDHYKKSFVFTLRPEEYYDDENHHDPFLEALNPEKILYCICFAKKDFFETTDANHVFDRKNRKNRKFFLTRRIFCFMTFYPFVKFFIELLEEILYKVKFYRLEQFTKNRSEEQEILNKIDLSSIDELIKSEIEPFLSRVLTTDLPHYGENYQIQGILRDKINYSLPTNDLAEYERSKWGVTLAFSNLFIDDLMFIIVSVLLEKKIIFFSKDIALLTGTIHTVFSILRPFTWPHPIIYNLPESLNTLLDAPVPYIFGINEDKSLLTHFRVKECYSSTIFIDLDENEIHYPSEKIKKILNLQPYLENAHLKIMTLYKTFNQDRFGFITKYSHKVKASENKKKTKNLIYNPNGYEQEQCKLIFEILKSALESCICNKIPRDAIMDEDMLDVEATAGALESATKNTLDQIFIRKFCKTQLFAFFLEQFYNKK